MKNLIIERLKTFSKNDLVAQGAHGDLDLWLKNQEEETLLRIYEDLSEKGIRES